MPGRDLRPLCPKCGCPARHVLAPALIRFELDLDNGERRTTSVRDVKRGPDDLYECGAGHTWRAPCNCENIGCDHGERPCSRQADPAKRLMYVGAVCAACHANTPTTYHSK